MYYRCRSPTIRPNTRNLHDTNQYSWKPRLVYNLSLVTKISMRYGGDTSENRSIDRSTIVQKQNTETPPLYFPDTPDAPTNKKIETSDTLETRARDSSASGRAPDPLSSALWSSSERRDHNFMKVDILSDSEICTRLLLDVCDDGSRWLRTRTVSDTRTEGCIIITCKVHT